jgi:hypothetical protein
MQFVCCSGKHVWYSARDAQRCCNPNWRRRLVVVPPGTAPPSDVDNVQVVAGVQVGRQWSTVDLDLTASE